MIVQQLSASDPNVRPAHQDSTTQQVGLANGFEPNVAATSQPRVG